MKRLLLLLLVISVLSGCSANVKKTPPLPDLNFSGNISVTYNKFDLLCSIENNLASECVITVLEPDLISGLQIVSDNGKYSFRLGEIVYDVDSSMMKRTEFVTTLTETFEQILKTTTVTELENGNWLYRGQTSLGEFTMVQDGVTGYPVTIRVPDSDLYIKFSNMKSNTEKGG